jgi:chitin disaccharide deacetylase
MTTPFALLLRRRCRAAGLLVPDRVFGLRWSGRMNRERLSGLIRHLPDGLNEIYVHLATGKFAGAAAGYHYREEFDALMAPNIVEACRNSSLRLGGFADFVDPEPVARATTGALMCGDGWMP